MKALARKLLKAVHEGSVGELEKILATRNINAQHPDIKNGMTVLMYAIFLQSEPRIECILNCLPNLKLADNDGYTAWDWAESSGGGMTQMLSDHEAAQNRGQQLGSVIVCDRRRSARLLENRVGAKKHEQSGRPSL